MGMTMPYVLPHLAALSPPWHKIELVNLFKQKEDYGGILPDLAGISVMTPMADEAYRIADEYRKRGVKVVIGGHHASALPHEAKSHADAVAVGEAEDTWKHILDDAEGNALKDFYIGGPLFDEDDFNGFSVYRSPERPVLAGFPLPRRELFKDRYFFDCIITTRGCPYRCKFCGTSRFYGGLIRHRPVEEVTAEIKQMGRFFLMADDDIFGDIQYRLELYSRMSGLKRFMRWHGAGAVSAVLERGGEEMVKLAAKSGLDTVFTGLESAEGDTLDALEINAKLRRREKGDLERIATAVKKIQSMGIMVFGFFVLGFDTDDEKSFEKTLEFCDRLNVPPIPFLLMPLPGTPLWDEMSGRISPGQGWGKWDGVHALCDHPALSPGRREELLYKLRIGAYTFRRIIRRLNGFSPVAAMNGLMMQAGIRRSFISDWKRTNGRI